MTKTPKRGCTEVSIWDTLEGKETDEGKWIWEHKAEGQQRTRQLLGLEKAVYEEPLEVSVNQARNDLS
jgi:hypothetical protein